MSQGVWGGATVDFRAFPILRRIYFGLANPSQFARVPPVETQPDGRNSDGYNSEGQSDGYRRGVDGPRWDDSVKGFHRYLESTQASRSEGESSHEVTERDDNQMFGKCGGMRENPSSHQEDGNCHE